MSVNQLSIDLTTDTREVHQMYEVYFNTDGESAFICNSLFGLNQCVDYLQKQGRKVSYTTINEYVNPISNFSSVKRWIEQ